MTKIIPDLVPPQVSDSAKGGTGNRRAVDEGAGSFSQILGNHRDAMSRKETVEGSGSLSEIQAPVPVGLAGLDTAGTVSARIEAALALLDSYAQGLADPGTTLKQSRGLLDELLDQARSLDELLGSSQSTEPEAQDIIRQLQTLIQVETVKFDRGDYLDTL